jgi:prepilin signal peptidase PulO-like enzyme (type II secretory pathway)
MSVPNRSCSPIKPFLSLTSRHLLSSLVLVVLVVVLVAVLMVLFAVLLVFPFEVLLVASLTQIFGLSNIMLVPVLGQQPTFKAIHYDTPRRL